MAYEARHWVRYKPLTEQYFKLPALAKFQIHTRKYVDKIMSSSKYKQALKLASAKLAVSVKRQIYGEVGSLPDFLILGAAKAGTTSLFYYLSQHPNISTPNRKKEVHYFDLNYNRGIDWYRNHFPQNNKRTLGASGVRNLCFEASPSYMIYPPALERIKKDIPSVKLIVLLRDPVERAYSHYRHNVRRGREKLSFRESLEAETERTSIKSQIPGNLKFETISPGYRHFSYVQTSLYAKTIKNIFEFFDKESVLLIKSRDLLSNPQLITENVFHFLAVDYLGKNIDFAQKNTGIGTKIENELILKYVKDIFETDIQNLKTLTGIDLS